MKILYVINDIEYFFAHRFSLAKEMQSIGHEIVVAAGNFNQTTDLTRLSEIQFISLDIDMHNFRPFNDIKLIKALAEVIKKVQPDTIHLFTIKPILYTSIASLALSTRSIQRSIKFVFTFAGLGKVFEYSTKRRHIIRKILVEIALRNLAKHLNVTATFENNSDLEKMIQKKIFNQRQCLTIMGAGIEPYTNKAPLRTGSLTFSFASRLIKGKGITTFLSVARRCKSNNIDAKFLVAGQFDTTNPDSITPNEIRTREIEGSIEYLGFLSSAEMSEHLSSIDVLCLPTRLQEGLPRVLLEAAASGCALIATDQPACRGIVRPNETGWLLSIADEENLYKAITEAINDRHKTREMGKKAQLLANKLPITHNHVFQKFLEIYTCRPSI